LTAIRLAFEGRYEPAVVAIVVAALLDGVDGRVARLLKGTSRFGAELDSLADFVNFGVTPALMLYSFLLKDLKAVGWIAVLVFAIAMVLRLARFNVMLDDPHRPEWKKNFFTGMPAPAGALTSMLPLYLSFLGVSMGPAAAPIALVYLLGLAFLMVSTIPVYSGKTIGLKVPRHWVLPIFVLSAAVFGLLANFPWEMLTVLTVLFLGSIPLSVMRYRQLDRAHAAQAAQPQPAVSEPEPPAA
jgi:CDP-diacylglycerol---serine O-phosphatidyltransferase